MPGQWRPPDSDALNTVTLKPQWGRASHIHKATPKQLLSTHQEPNSFQESTHTNDMNVGSLSASASTSTAGSPDCVPGSLPSPLKNDTIPAAMEKLSVGDSPQGSHFPVVEIPAIDTVVTLTGSIPTVTPPAYSVAPPPSSIAMPSASVAAPPRRNTTVIDLMQPHYIRNTVPQPSPDDSCADSSRRCSSDSNEEQPSCVEVRDPNLLMCTLLCISV